MSFIQFFLKKFIIEKNHFYGNDEEQLEEKLKGREKMQFFEIGNVLYLSNLRPSSSATLEL
jgi:hypothetical protein